MILFHAYKLTLNVSNDLTFHQAVSLTICLQKINPGLDPRGKELPFVHFSPISLWLSTLLRGRRRPSGQLVGCLSYPSTYAEHTESQEELPR